MAHKKRGISKPRQRYTIPSSERRKVCHRVPTDQRIAGWMMAVTAVAFAALTVFLVISA